MNDASTPRTASADLPRGAANSFDSSAASLRQPGRIEPYRRIAIVILRLALELLDRGRHFDAAADVSGAIDKLGWTAPRLSEGEAIAWLDKHTPAF